MLGALTPEELQARADELWWFHSVDLGRGVVTKGAADFAWRSDQLPPVAGRSVLDIGTWNGGYSFMAERNGASRVVALDHYAWGVDFTARDQYWRECSDRGVLPDHSRDVTDFWCDRLPGRVPFDFAHEALNSKVEPVLADFSTMDLDELGSFDVVLYLGVLYHMPEPLQSLRRVRRVTKAVAAIETLALNLPGRNRERFLEFHEGDDLGSDFGNWYVPTTEALIALCRAADFDRVKVIVGTPPAPSTWRSRVRGALLRPPSDAVPFGYFRTLVHAYP